MKKVFLIAGLFLTSISHADPQPIRCQAFFQTEREGKTVTRNADLLVTYQRDGIFKLEGDLETGGYSFNIDLQSKHYWLNIALAPDYTAGALTSGEWESKQKPVNLNFIRGATVYRLTCESAL